MLYHFTSTILTAVLAMTDSCAHLYAPNKVCNVETEVRLSLDAVKQRLAGESHRASYHYLYNHGVIECWWRGIWGFYGCLRSSSEGGMERCRGQQHCESIYIAYVELVT